MNGIAHSFVIGSLLACATGARAAPVLVDDFTGLAPGADLYASLRTPHVGPPGASAEWQRLDGHADGVAVQAVAGLDAIAADLRVPQGSALDYKAQLGALTVSRFTVSWQLNVREAPASFGGFFLRLPTAARFDPAGHRIDPGFEPLVGILNDGSLAFFDAAPSLDSLRLFGRITFDGTHALALRVDLPSRRYTFLVDGIERLFDQALPDVWAAEPIDSFGFDVPQHLAGAGDGLAHYLVDDVALDVAEPPLPVLLALLAAGLAARWRGWLRPRPSAALA